MIVVDASVMIELLIGGAVFGQLKAELRAGRHTLHAPHLIDLEVVQVIRRYCANGQLSPERGRQALQDLASTPMDRYQHWPLLRRIWELRQGITAYDAAYIALAEALGAPLITRDQRLAAAGGHRARVELI